MFKSNPKVFVSHASEDKDRFVESFAVALRSQGIDAWLDKWEMKPGDSLVDKIFEEGVKNAQAVIVVISKNSIDKPWVREEINAAFVKKVNTGSKLIPVLIDNCEVPVCMQSTKYAFIKDLDNYENELNDIVMSVLGQYEKPSLGDLPKYADSKVYIPNLHKIDGQVLIAACEWLIQNNGIIIQNDGMKAVMDSLGITAETLGESLQVLDKAGYIEGMLSLGSKGFHAFKIRNYGMETYLESCFENYGSLQKEIALQIVNHGLNDSKIISEKIKQPIRIVEHILDDFQSMSFIDHLRWWGPETMRFITVNPTLKRWLSEQD